MQRGKRRGWWEEPRPTRGDRHGDPSRPEAWGDELGGLPAFGQGHPPGSEPPRDAGWWRDAERARVAAARYSSGPRSAPRSDASILEDCWQELASHSDLDHAQIELDVEAGFVRLRGSVTSRFAKQRAEDLCAAVRGVTDVHNRLRVADPPR